MAKVQYGYITSSGYLWGDIFDSIEECEEAVEEYYDRDPEDMDGSCIVEIRSIKVCEIPRTVIWHDC